jgi:hypothetical protein
MIHMLLVFLVTLLIVALSIHKFSSLTRIEKWEFTKILFYGIILSLVTATILAAIVLIF